MPCFNYLCIKINNKFPIFYQVQIEVIQKRQKEKKAMMSAVKKYQKGEFLFLLVVVLCIWKKNKKKLFCIYFCVVNLNVCFYEYVIYDLWCPYI